MQQTLQVVVVVVVVVECLVQHHWLADDEIL
jgi:hypothetical protein